MSKAKLLELIESKAKSNKKFAHGLLQSSNSADLFGIAKSVFGEGSTELKELEELKIYVRIDSDDWEELRGKIQENVSRNEIKGTQIRDIPSSLEGKKFPRIDLKLDDDWKRDSRRTPKRALPLKKRLKLDDDWKRDSRDDIGLGDEWK